MTGSVRAGTYAVFEGRTFHAGSAAGSPVVGLVLRGDSDPGEGFVWDERLGGHWHRGVPRAACSRVVRVVTAAFWRDFPVEVVDVREDLGTATVSYHPDRFPDLSPRAPDGTPREPDLPVDHGRGWTGPVPLGELSGVVSQEHDVPVEAPRGGWTLPRPPRPGPPHAGT